MKFRSICLLFLLSVLSININAQKKPAKTETTPAVKTDTQPPVKETATLPTVNPLTEHYYKKYVTAIQWSDYDVAKDALYDLIIENPQNDSLIFNLAYFYFDNQKYVSAVLIAQQLLAQNPKDVSALEITAVGYENMGLKDRALQSYESLYLLTNSVGSLYKMAFLQYDLKRLSESLATIDILIANKETDTVKVVFNDAENKAKEYPMKVAVLNLKGLVTQEQTGDKVAAKKIFEQALAIAPDFVPAKQNLEKLK
jgi:tetratricopeptide (TPR) repeat protein